MSEASICMLQILCNAEVLHHNNQFRASCSRARADQMAGAPNNLKALLMA